MIDKDIWHRKFKAVFMKIAGVSAGTAQAIIDDPEGEFDYGYSPFWYANEIFKCKENL